MNGDILALVNKKVCYGCSACYSICPPKAIQMVPMKKVSHTLK